MGLLIFTPKEIKLLRLHNSEMKRLLLPLIAALALPAAAQAGLGEAEEPTKREFSAWCGKAGNDCTVVFTNASLTVNGTDGIKRSQMTSFSSNKNWISCCPNYNYYFMVNYKEDGAIKAGKFIFANSSTAKTFKETLLWFCPTCNRVYKSDVDNT